VLLVFGAPCQLPSLAGQEHGRTIPLADVTLAAGDVCCKADVSLRLVVGLWPERTFGPLGATLQKRLRSGWSNGGGTAMKRRETLIVGGLPLLEYTSLITMT